MMALLGKFTAMDMRTVLHRIEIRRQELGVSEAALSRRATGSTDTIRNWRRRVERGDEKAGASTVTLEKVAEALGRTVQWLYGDGPESAHEIDSLVDGRERAMRLYDSLPPDLQAVAEQQLAALVQARSSQATPSPASTARKPSKRSAPGG